MHRKLSTAIGAAVAGGAATVLFATPAMAADVQSNAGVQPASETTAPACVNRNVINFNLVDLTNHCGKTMHLAIDWGWAAPNSPCYTVANGATKRIESNIPTANYSKTVLC